MFGLQESYDSVFVITWTLSWARSYVTPHLIIVIMNLIIENDKINWENCKNRFFFIFEVLKIYNIANNSQKEMGGKIMFVCLYM